ncbi:MAG: hypothetical protein ABI539_10690 [Acidobacteriota bacterium]
MSYSPRKTIALGISFALSISAFSQHKSEREQRGYKGNVKAVRTEVVSYSYESRKVKIEKRRVDLVESFDRSGNLLSEMSYGDDGAVLWDEKNTYQNGRLVETSRKHSPFSYLPDRVVYKYDDSGNVIEENGYDLTGKLVSNSLYEYDGKNRKIQLTSRSYFEHEDHRPHRWTYSYDEQGRVKEEKVFRDEGTGFIPTDALGGPHRKLYLYRDLTRSGTMKAFNAAGGLVGSSLSVYDGMGNELEDIRFDEKGDLKEKTRYEYVFDRLGNWTIQKTFEWDGEGKNGTYRLSEVSYQILTFYRSNDVKKAEMKAPRR